MTDTSTPECICGNTVGKQCKAVNHYSRRSRVGNRHERRKHDALLRSEKRRIALWLEQIRR